MKSREEREWSQARKTLVPDLTTLIAERDAAERRRFKAELRMVTLPMELHLVEERQAKMERKLAKKAVRLEALRAERAQVIAAATPAAQSPRPLRPFGASAHSFHAAAVLGDRRTVGGAE